MFVFISSFFSSWFPEWRSHSQWRCLSGESSAPCSGPVVLRRIGWVWGQHSTALPPGLTGLCYPAPEKLVLPGRSGSWGVLATPFSILLEEKVGAACHDLPQICLQVACALKECLGPKSRRQILHSPQKPSLSGLGSCWRPLGQPGTSLGRVQSQDRAAMGHALLWPCCQVLAARPVKPTCPMAKGVL